jgi:hypothetical protein
LRETGWYYDETRLSWNTLTIDDSSLFANPRETFYGEFGKTKRMFLLTDSYVALDPDLF